MAGVSEAAEWLRAERSRLGMSAAQLADRARKFADKEGYPSKLQQQSISAFENGTAKRMPVWFRFVEMAIAEAQGREPQAKLVDPETAQAVSMMVLMPSEAALARMFEGLLRPIDREMPVDELARILAQRLPTGLAQLRDLAPARGQGSATAPDISPPARATARRAPPRERNT